MVIQFNTHIIFGVFSFDSFEGLVCGPERAADQPDREVKWGRHPSRAQYDYLSVSSDITRGRLQV